jgi:hypothetical protein
MRWAHEGRTDARKRPESPSGQASRARRRPRERPPKPKAQKEAAARGGGRGPAARQAAPPQQAAPGPPRHTRKRERRGRGEGSAAPDVERLHRREARQTGGERGGAVRTDAVRTAGERERGSIKVRGSNGPGVGGFLFRNYNHHLIIIEILSCLKREREKNGPVRRKRAPAPDHLFSAQTQQSGRHSSQPTTRPDRPADKPAGKYSGYSDQPTPTGRYSGAGRRILWELASGSERGGRFMGGRGERRERKRGGKR